MIYFKSDLAAASHHSGLSVLLTRLLPSSLHLLLLVQNHPIVLIVVLVSVSLEEFPEHVSNSCVLRPLVEPQVSALAEILGELSWVALAQDLNTPRTT